MPVVLDTDHLSILQWREQPACDRLLARLAKLAPDDIATTIVSFHEQVQGWMAYLNRTIQSRRAAPPKCQPTQAKSTR